MKLSHSLSPTANTIATTMRINTEESLRILGVEEEEDSIHHRNSYQSGHEKDPSSNNASSGGGAASSFADYVAPTTSSTTTPSTTTATTSTATTTTSATTTATTAQAEQQNEVEFSHSKDPSANTAGNDPADTAETGPTEYEAQFPPRTTGTPLSSADLFADPNAFSPSSIYSQRHYLTGELTGVLWHDVDGDGLRGSYTNSTLNALEYDTGIGGVSNIALVHCESNEIAKGSGVSLPNLGKPSLIPRTFDGNSGRFQFAMSGSDVPEGRYYVLFQSPTDFRLSANVLPLERQNVQVTNEGGKTTYFDCLPRGGEGREFAEEAKEVGDLDFPGYCARSIGCFEIGRRGELEQKFADLVELSEAQHFSGATFNSENSNSKNSNDLVVALPTPYNLEIGLAEDPWELAAHQFASVELSISFPTSVKLADVEKDLAGLFAEEDAFQKSSHRTSVEKAIMFALNGGNEESEQKKIDEETMTDQDTTVSGGQQGTKAVDFSETRSKAGDFSIKGVSLKNAKVNVKKNKIVKISDSYSSIASSSEKAEGDTSREVESAEPAASRSRFLRASSRKLQQVAGQVGKDEQDSSPVEEEEETVEITYSFTSRGAYRPPPHNQLGHAVQSSINANKDPLVKAFRQTEDFPEFYKDVEDVEGRHLTVGPTLEEVQDQQQVAANGGGSSAIEDMYKSFNENNANGSKMESWAFIPVIILAVVLASLIGLFLFRRVFVRRRKVNTVNLPKTQELERDLKGSMRLDVMGYDSDDGDDSIWKEGMKKSDKCRRKMDRHKSTKKKPLYRGESDRKAGLENVLEEERHGGNEVEIDSADPPGHNARRTRRKCPKGPTSSSSTSASSGGSRHSCSVPIAEESVSQEAEDNIHEGLKTLDTKEGMQRRRSRKKNRGDSFHELTTSNGSGSLSHTRSGGSSRYGSNPSISISNSTLDTETGERKKRSKKKRKTNRETLDDVENNGASAGQQNTKLKKKGSSSRKNKERVEDD